MSRALNPQTTGTFAVLSGRETGRPADSESANALMVPMAHMAGRLVPIYALRPTSRQTTSKVSTQIGDPPPASAGWDIPHYPIHGLDLEQSETSLDGEFLGAFMGPVTEQFGPSFAASIQAQLWKPSGGTGPMVEAIEVDAAVVWDDLSSTAAEGETIQVLSQIHRSAPEDPGDVLNPHAISQRYEDIGPYNLTCRDLHGTKTLSAGLQRAAVVQTGETDSLATDTAAHIESTLALGDVGGSSSTARVHVASMSVYGINSDDADTAGTAAGGFTVIPGVFPFTQRFGGGAPRSGQVLTSVMRDLIHAERTIYGNRGQTLLSRRRIDSLDTTVPTSALFTDDSTNWSTVERGSFFRLPDVLPGSANITGAGSSTTLALRGGFRGRVIMRNADVVIGVRTVTIAGTYGQTSTFGAWNLASASETVDAAFVGFDVTDDATSVADHVLLPSGISPGDDYELAIWWRSRGGDAYLSGWEVYEPALSTVA